MRKEWLFPIKNIGKIARLKLLLYFIAELHISSFEETVLGNTKERNIIFTLIFGV